MSDTQLAQPQAQISDEAWNAIQGAYDMHIHVAPDVIARRIDDIDLAKEFLARGLRGFTLKSHYVPTTERASCCDESRAPNPSVWVYYSQPQYWGT